MKYRKTADEDTGRVVLTFWEERRTSPHTHTLMRQYDRIEVLESDAMTGRCKCRCYPYPIVEDDAVIVEERGWVNATKPFARKLWEEAVQDGFELLVKDVPWTQEDPLTDMEKSYNKGRSATAKNVVNALSNMVAPFIGSLPSKKEVEKQYDKWKNNKVK